jgi:hypothetical protein
VRRLFYEAVDAKYAKETVEEEDPLTDSDLSDLEPKKKSDKVEETLKDEAEVSEVESWILEE